MRKFICLIAILCLAVPVFSSAAFAAEFYELLPVDVSQTPDRSEIRKVYEMATSVDPSMIPRSAFERDNFYYSCRDILREVIIGDEIKTLTESETIESPKNDIESVMNLLPPTKEALTEDGFFGTLYLNTSSIKSEVSGYGSKTSPVNITRSYPNLSDADMQYISDANNNPLIANTNFDHGRHVAGISRIIALKYGYSADEAAVIEQAASFHDVGKTAIPPEILNKPSRLTPEEFAIVKTHTEAGYTQIMEVVKLLLVSAAVAKEHHERLDASGYLRMPACDINPYARIISIADVFDALVSRRSYKEAWDVTTAVQYLIDHGNQFDREIVKCLVGAINEILLIYKTDTSRTETGQGS